MSEETRYVDCHECGAHHALHYFKDIEERLLANRLCHACDHWTSLVKIKDRADVVRAGSVHYMIGGETSDPKHWRGFGGDRFKVAFHDGREVVSTNVWCQGHIPDHFKARLPDNATFLTAFEAREENAHASV